MLSHFLQVKWKHTHTHTHKKLMTIAIQEKEMQWIEQSSHSSVAFGEKLQQFIEKKPTLHREKYGNIHTISSRKTL